MPKRPIKAKTKPKAKGQKVVRVGSLVTWARGKQKSTYQLIPVFQTPKIGKSISINSAVGKAILGKRVGHIVTVHSPLGTYKIKILKIQ